jgi:hypothetical protein
LKNRINFLLLILYIVLAGFKPAWQKVATISVLPKLFEIDPLGNTYVVNNANQLYKFNGNGELLSTLNYGYFGNISHIDCSNPLEIYVFYKELNTLIFLDNNLAFRGKINLSDVGITQASVAGRAYDNSIWVFDLGDLQLKKLGRDGRLAQQSGNTLQLIQGNRFNPNYLKDNGNQVFLNDSAIGILVFDVFANYVKTLGIKGVNYFTLSNQHLQYFQGKQLLKYHLVQKVNDTLELPVNRPLQVKMFQNQVYIVDSNQFGVYTFD